MACFIYLDVLLCFCKCSNDLSSVEYEILVLDPSMVDIGPHREPLAVNWSIISLRVGERRDKKKRVKR
jgi:hypothetical protein